MEESLAQAKILFNKKRYKEVIHICQQHLNRDSLSIEALKLISKSYLVIKDIDSAKLYLNRILNLNLNDYEIIKDLGNLYQIAGDFKTAKKCYQRSISLNVNYAPALSNLGILELHNGNKDEALILLIKATRSDSNSAPAWINLTTAYIKKKDIKNAEIACKRAIEIDPNVFNPYFLLSKILISQSRFEEAINNLQKTIDLKSDFVEAFFSLGETFLALGKIKEAKAAYQEIIKIKPNSHFAYSNLSNLHKETGELKEAELLQTKAINLKPNVPEMHNNMGSILKDLGKIAEAEFHLKKAIALKPNFSLAHSNLGILLEEIGQYKEAELSYKRAIKIQPDFAEGNFHLSLLNLKLGNYKDGLEGYEFRWKIKKPSYIYGNPIIDRKDDAIFSDSENILVIGEQSKGDIIFHMRYLLALKAKNIRINFCAPEILHNLIKSSGIHSKPISPNECANINKGKWLPLMSLLRYFSVSPKNPVINPPYIFAENNLRQKWKDILSKENKPLIAINWQGSRKIELSSYKGRSIPLEKFSILLKNNDIKFVSLQKGFGSEQRQNCSFKKYFVDCQSFIDEANDFSETAAIIENCDLVITIDCSIAPLAGGMGKEVWLMLTKNSFWTWGLHKERTFWFPSMRLFRQNQLFNWDEVMENISSELSNYLKNTNT